MIADAGAVNLMPWELNPHRLWSLWDMLEVSALDYIDLGERIAHAHIVFVADAIPGVTISEELKRGETAHLTASLKLVLAECQKLGLAASAHLVESRINNLPKTAGEFTLLMDAVRFEIQSKKFFFVPPHRAKYYKLTLPSTLTDAFPLASKEIVAAGNCFAADVYTASVFHAMRAAEIGVRALANEIGGIEFPFEIEYAEFASVIEKIEGKIRDMKSLPKGRKKDIDLQFYSEAASQFRYFKDGWRVRAAHARETFDEGQALTVFDHTLSFFETLAKRGLKEPTP